MAQEWVPASPCSVKKCSGLVAGVDSNFCLGYTAFIYIYLFNYTCLTMSFNPVKTVSHCLLVIAFISMQFSSAHIHLAKSHNHDAGAHHHAQLGHSHALADHHQDSFDTSEALSYNQVVELSQSYAPQGWGYYPDKVILLAHAIAPKGPYQASYVHLFYTPFNSQSNWLSYSIVRLRAPPTLYV